MELLKWLFDKNTRHGRGMRTALQGIIAIITFVFGIMTLPGVDQLVLANNWTTAGTFGTWVGVISYTQNALEDLWKLIK